MAEFSRNEKTEQRVRVFSKSLKNGRMRRVQRLINALLPSELADVLESLPPAPRAAAWKLVDLSVEGEVLVHVNDEVRISLIEGMEPRELVDAASDLDIDDLADIVEDLPATVSNQLIQEMDAEDREYLNRVLAYPEDSAGGLMNPEVVMIRHNVTLEVVIRYIRRKSSKEELPELIDPLYVVDRDQKFLGKLSLTDLLTKDADIIVEDVIFGADETIEVDAPDSEVATRFEHKDWISAPVVDSDKKLLGRITIDDIVDVIRDEADHSILSMAGLDEENDMFAPVFASSKRRALYLGVNLITAFIAAWFVGIFDKTVEQVVALAILMPVVASMGGITGTQTLTLMIRGMAMGQVGPSNSGPLLNKELAVAGINGLVWAVVVGVIAVTWFDNSELALVVATAILINMLTGALAGVVIPVILKKLSIDPALAGGMVLTTVTDVVGFVSLLGLGTLLLT